MTDNTTTPQAEQAAAPAPTTAPTTAIEQADIDRLKAMGVDSLAAQVLALQGQLTKAHVGGDEARRAVEGIRDRLIATTVEMGQEHDYCLDGMSEFVAPVLAIITAEARKLLEQSMTRRYSVTIEYEVCGAAEYPDNFTESEAKSFVVDAINPASGTTVDVLYVYTEEM